MSLNNLKIFAIGYSDSTSTSYLLDYLILHGVDIDGVIFPKNNVQGSWSRLTKKIQVRGFVPAIRRIFENVFVRKGQISKICQDHIKKVFLVDNINSHETRKILISNSVDLVLLTASPILKPVIIDIEGLTILNAHTGWLPKYRGLDANLKALKDGAQPGISIHKVTERIDAGEVYLREHFEINHGDGILTQLEVEELKLAGKLLVEAVDLKSKNMLKPLPIAEPLGKYESPLTKKEKKNILRTRKNLRKNS